MNDTTRIPPLPPGLTGESLTRALNDRFRRIGLNTSQSNASASATAAAGGTLLLTVSGTLGMLSDAAPWVALDFDGAPSEVAALLKQPARGGDVQLRLFADDSPVANLTIAEGSTSASTSGVSRIPAGAVIVLAILGVGLDFPGADLTVMVRF